VSDIDGSRFGASSAKPNWARIKGSGVEPILTDDRDIDAFGAVRVYSVSIASRSNIDSNLGFFLKFNRADVTRADTRIT
jgi:hypothetical protein